MLHLCIVLFAPLSLLAHGQPPALYLHPREDRPTAVIETTITDHSGTVVSSSFQTRIYQQASFLTNNSLSNRAGPFVRSIDTCSDANEIFLNSQCDSEEGKAGSLQAFIIMCRYWNHFERGTVRSIYQGHCEEDEICIQATTPPGVGIPAGRAKMAMCVEQRGFTKVGKGNTQWGTLAKSFQSTYLSMTASKVDLSTVIEVDTLNVEASSRGQSAALGSTHKNKNYCRDCTQLETEKFPDGIDLLKTQTRLLETGTTLTGILWIAVLSG